MKAALDIGNSTVKGTLLSDDNKMLSSLRFPSSVATIADPKYLTYTEQDEIYLQVLQSPLAHFDTIVAVGDDAMALPNYQEYDVTATSYKTNHPLTTSLLFGSLARAFLQDENPSPHLALTVSIPTVEAKSIGLAEHYQNLLLGEHVLRLYHAHQTIDFHVHIQQVKVLNEGQAGFLGLLDTSDTTFQSTMMTIYKALGESQNPVGDLSDFLIVDIGEGTTDLAVFRDKHFNVAYSYSITKGYGNLLEEAMATAEREQLTIESRKALQQVLADLSPRRKARRDQWMAYVTPTREAFIQSVCATILKAYGKRDYFDAILFIGGGFTALTGYRVHRKAIQMTDDTLFTRLESQLTANHKTVDLLFGIPEPYAQGINERGLTQVLTNLSV